METHEYACHDGVGLSGLIRRGEVSAAEVEQAARRALETVNEKINGLAAPLFTPALDHGDGPFTGVPFLIKDIGPMARGVPFYCGSRALGPGVPAQEDHELMARFRAAVRAAECLAGLGHHVDVASPVLDWESVVSAVAAEAVASAAPFLLAPRQPPAERFEAVSRVMIAAARERRAVDLVAGLNAAGRVSRAVARFFADTDLLVTPTLARPPAPHGTLDYDEDGHTVEGWLRTLFDHGPFTAVFNIAGQPAISLPLGESADGLPIGVQLVAAHGREDLLLRVAGQLERALPWAHRTPAVHAGHG
ncbi:amidase family protein [Parafrankia sp. FMc6]|uniref:amidase family protein n=1 Tax=Parafrankia soli TaxID=2599596 RepID=UPI0034D438F2